MPDDWTLVDQKPSLPRLDMNPAKPKAGVPTGAPSGQGDAWTLVDQKPSQTLDANKLIKKGGQFLQQRDENINYDTGASFATRVLLQRASNADEAKLVLNKLYGKNNFGQDRFGQWWVKEGDQRVAVLPKGFKGALANMGTGAVASTGPTVGAALGGIAGEALFPAGGGIPGAMVGAAAGKGLDDFVKWAQGLFAKKPAEVVSGMAHEGTIAGVFQGAGPAARGVGNLIKKGVQHLGEVTPATRAMAGHLAGGGARPPVGSYAPGLTATEYHRQLSNILAGRSPYEQANIRYLDQRMRGILAQEGILPPEIDRLMTEVYQTSARTSTTEAGQAVVGRAQQIHRELVNEHDTARQAVEQGLRNDEQFLRQVADAPATLGRDIAHAIVSRRRAFARLAGDMYRTIDQMTGNTPVVPTSGIRAAATEMLQVMPPQAVPPIIRQWAGAAPMGTVERITFEQAHALRSVLREMGRSPDVRAAGINPRNLRAMAQAVDDAIGRSEGQLGQQAAAALRVADQRYAEGIAMFDNTAIKRIVKELRSGIIPEPGTVVELFMKPGNTELARTVLNLLPPNVRNGVIAADLGNMIARASSRGENNVLALDARVFSDILDARNNLLVATYPAGLLRNLRTFSMELAALDGRIDVGNLRNQATTQVIERLQRAVGALRAADEFVKNNPLGAFVNGTPAQVDRTVARLTQPGAEATTEQAARTLGVDSPEWRAVRRHALIKLFSSSVEETKSLGKTVTGAAIDKKLSNYTARQQALLFPGGLADDVRLLAKEAKFLFPETNKDIGSSLAAATIKGRLPAPSAIVRYAHVRIAGWLADHPMLLRFLASEVRRNPEQGRRVLGVVGDWIVNRTLARAGINKQLKGMGPGLATQLGVVGMWQGPGTGAPTSNKDQARVPSYAGTED